MTQYFRPKRGITGHTWANSEYDTTSGQFWTALRPNIGIPVREGGMLQRRGGIYGQWDSKGLTPSRCRLFADTIYSPRGFEADTLELQTGDGPGRLYVVS